MRIADFNMMNVVCLNEINLTGQPVVGRRTSGRRTTDKRSHGNGQAVAELYAQTSFVLLLAELELFYPLSPFHLFEHVFRNQSEQTVFHCVVTVGEREESVGSQPFCPFLGQ